MLKKNYHVDSGQWTRKKQHDLGWSLPCFTQNSDLITRLCFFTKEDSLSSCLMTSIWTAVMLSYFFVSCSSCSFMTDAVLNTKQINFYLKMKVNPKPCIYCALHTPPSSQRKAVAWMFFCPNSSRQTRHKAPFFPQVVSFSMNRQCQTIVAITQEQESTKNTYSQK